MSRRLWFAGLRGLAAAWLGACTAASAVAQAAAPSATEIVERADIVMWGRKTMQGEFEMSVITPAWTRTLTLKAWVERPGRTFTRVTAPAKEAGTGSLAIAPEMWNYVPSLERTIKIPPSLMLQSWFGSDFTNDDMVNQGSVARHYEHRLVGEKTVDGTPAYEIEMLPKPDAPVAWGRIVALYRKPDAVPLVEQFYDERGALVRTVRYGDIKPVSGLQRPTRMEVVPASPPGKRSVMVMKSVVVDEPIDPAVFTLQNLTRR